MRLGRVLGLAALSIAGVFAQSVRTLAEGQIGPYQTITTIRFELLSSEAIATEVVGARGRLDTVVSAFDSNSRLLEKQDEEESVLPMPFRWIPKHAGRFYLQIRNVTAEEGKFSVRIIGGQTSRGVGEKNYAEVRVFFATNRTRSGKSFSGVPDLKQSHHGVTSVSIPRDHRLGELETNQVSRLFRLDSNPSREVAVLNVEEEPGDRFFDRIRRRVLPSGKRSALVFIHGFNVPFEDAVRRTAQIAYDLRFDGAAIVFSWPSAGELSPLSYNRDGEMAELSIAALERFLAQIQQQSGATDLHIIAHSMGNRLLLRALERIVLKQTAPKSRMMGEVIFMAPDVEVNVFRELSRTITATGRRFTLYASDKDAALQLSQKFHRGPRAGQGGNQTLVIQGIDSIDASRVETNTFGLHHSYYGDSSSILYDLDQVLHGRPIAERIGLRQARNSNGLYWEFIGTAR